MSILNISFPEDFDEKYDKFSNMLLDILNVKDPPIFGDVDVVEAEEEVIQEAEKEKQKSTDLLFSITKETQWKDITIKFKNDFDVDVIIGKKTYPSNYETMKFADKRVKKTNEKAKANDSWQFLFLLSTVKGIFPIDKLTGKDKKQRIKNKQILTKSLKALFPTIDDDPFYEYNDIEKVYKIKINLIPVETFRDDFRDRNIRDDSDEILGEKSYYKDLTNN